MQQQSIQEIFKSLRNQPAPIEVSEEDLKRGQHERKREAYFVPAQMQEIFNNLPKEQQETYKWYGEQYYSGIIDGDVLDVNKEARKHLNAVKLGLPFKNLSDDEKMLIRKIYGKEWYKEIGLESEED